MRNWQDAQERIRQWEARGQIEQPGEQRTTLATAIERFTTDAVARGLTSATMQKYLQVFTPLEAFAEHRGITFIEQLDLPSLLDFRATWKTSGITAQKKIERLRAFFRFAQECEWTNGNPAAKIKSPKITHTPTLPFEQDEIIRIIAACEHYPDNYGRTSQPNARRLRALVLLLRYSGLRIGDAVRLTDESIRDGKLFLRTAKTGTTILCPLPDFVIAALNECTRTSAHFYFWTGEGKPRSAVGDWQRSLRKLFRLADVEHGHAHRFRDTYAVELLLSGVPLERVSVLLGHSSIRITEKHYAPWVRARQEQLEADVRRSWSSDPFYIGEQKHAEAIKPN